MKSMIAAILPSRFWPSQEVEPVPVLERRPRCYWAVTCEIDYFQRFNDIYGRIVGDDALRQVAWALAQACQGEEQVFNRRGAEFVIIVQGETLDRARACAEYHRAAVETLQIPHQGSPLGIVTVSMGLATIVSGSLESTSDALDNADVALRRAKQAGPNQVASETNFGPA